MPQRTERRPAFRACTAHLDDVDAAVFPGGDQFVTVANEFDTRTA